MSSSFYYSPLNPSHCSRNTIKKTYLDHNTSISSSNTFSGPHNLCNKAQSPRYLWFHTSCSQLHFVFSLNTYVCLNVPHHLSHSRSGWGGTGREGSAPFTITSPSSAAPLPSNLTVPLHRHFPTARVTQEYLPLSTGHISSKVTYHCPDSKPPLN